MALLPIRIYGDPVLRKKCEPITEITPELRQLARDMLETLYDAPGCGLAAPQIGKSIRLVVSTRPFPTKKNQSPISCSTRNGNRKKTQNLAITTKAAFLYRTCSAMLSAPTA